MSSGFQEPGEGLSPAFCSDFLRKRNRIREAAGGESIVDNGRGRRVVEVYRLLLEHNERNP